MPIITIQRSNHFGLYKTGTDAYEMLDIYANPAGWRATDEIAPEPHPDHNRIFLVDRWNFRAQVFDEQEEEPHQFDFDDVFDMFTEAFQAGQTDILTILTCCSASPHGIPCLNCIAYGWSNDPEDGNGHGVCANCVDNFEPNAVEEQLVPGTWAWNPNIERDDEYPEAPDDRTFEDDYWSEDERDDSGQTTPRLIDNETSDDEGYGPTPGFM